MSTAVAVVVVAVVLLALLASFLPALAAPRTALLPAHAQLLSTTPEDGASLESVDEVVLSFNEDIGAEFLQVRVEGPDGDETDGDPTADGRDVVQPLAADLPAGEHTVTYRVVSADGHPVSGSFSFTTTQEPAPASPSPSSTPAATATPSPTATAQTPDPTPAPDAAGETAAVDSGTPGWLVPVLLVLALALLVGGGLAVRRRQAHGRD